MFRYACDPAGNITQIEKHRAGMDADSGVFEYTYDKLGQLVAAVHGEKIKRYRYDELGNRVKSWVGGKYDDGATTLHSYNALNQLIRTQEGEDVKEYRYDKRGNLTQITENGQVKASYTFDASNMMVEAFAVGKGTAEYTYNGLMQRIKKLEEPQTPDPMQEVRYVLDMTLPYDNLLMMQGEQNQRFVWGNGLLAAEGAESYGYLSDHLGSPIRLLGSEDDTPLAYDEFGVPLVEAGNNVNQPFGFTGYQSDSISELWYAQARYYMPQAGRFISEDIIKGAIANPLTLNTYEYCWNKPLGLVDKDGLSPIFLMPDTAALIRTDIGTWMQRGQSAIEWGSQAATDVGNWTVQAATDVGNWTVQAATDVGNWTVQAATDVQNLAQQTVNWAAQTKLGQDIQNYDPQNTDEIVVLNSNYFSVYKGQTVIRWAPPNGRSFSFDTLFIAPGLSNYLGTTNENYAIDTIKHEYGHTKQLEQMGTVPYFLFFGIPSMLSGGVPSSVYYNLPWEVTADIYGGVTSRIPDPNALQQGKMYLAAMSYFFGKNSLVDSAKLLIECLV